MRVLSSSIGVFHKYCRREFIRLVKDVKTFHGAVAGQGRGLNRVLAAPVHIYRYTTPELKFAGTSAAVSTSRSSLDKRYGSAEAETRSLTIAE